MLGGAPLGLAALGVPDAVSETSLFGSASASATASGSLSVIRSLGGVAYARATPAAGLTTAVKWLAATLNVGVRTEAVYDYTSNSGIITKMLGTRTRVGVLSWSATTYVNRQMAAATPVLAVASASAHLTRGLATATNAYARAYAAPVVVRALATWKLLRFGLRWRSIWTTHATAEKSRGDLLVTTPLYGEADCAVTFNATLGIINNSRGGANAAVTSNANMVVARGLSTAVQVGAAASANMLVTRGFSASLSCGVTSNVNIFINELIPAAECRQFSVKADKREFSARAEKRSFHVQC